MRNIGPHKMHGLHRQLVQTVESRKVQQVCRLIEERATRRLSSRRSCCSHLFCRRSQSIISVLQRVDDRITIRKLRDLCQSRRLLSTSPETAAVSIVHETVSPALSVFFRDVPFISASIKTALERAGLKEMTEIQAKTMHPIREGQDVIARARTGTGKTMAFLVPAIERIKQQQLANCDDNLGPSGVQMLIVSPTRELAEQIYRQALILTQQQSTSPISCQVIYGGTPKSQETKRLQARIPTILIATPGRLLDHLESTILSHPDDNNNTTAPFSFRDCFTKTSILVLDEMDRLLDMGFSRDINEIIPYLPQQDRRQTLLLSATMPASVQTMMQSMVRADATTIDCVQDDDPTTHTNTFIEQSYVLLPPDRIVSGIVELVWRLSRPSRTAKSSLSIAAASSSSSSSPSSSDDDKELPPKILIFFPTTAQVEYFYHLFARLAGGPQRVLQLHSQMNQGMRSTASDQFRWARTGVLLTTDISARGVDYPDVTHVIQVGAANTREIYLHRLGRTGRAGKRGQGLLVLVDMELKYLQQDLAGLSIEPNHRLQGLLDGSVPVSLHDDLMRVHHDMRTGQADDLCETANIVYKSILGYYSTRLKAFGIRSVEPLVQLVNAFASQAGLVELPAVSERLAKQSGLFGHSRIRVDARWVPGSTFQVSKLPLPKRK